MKYIDAEKLKTEIDNLESFSCISEEQDGFYSAIGRVIDIIDSLQQEQPDVDLEKEMEEYFGENWKDGTPIEEQDAMIKFARHFAQWGAEHLKK